MFRLVYEGYPDLCHKEEVSVETGSGAVTGMMYVMNDGYPIHKPSNLYRETCMKGYETFGFDTDILKRCESKSFSFYNVRDTKREFVHVFCISC